MDELLNELLLELEELLTLEGALEDMLRLEELKLEECVTLEELVEDDPPASHAPRSLQA